MLAKAWPGNKATTLDDFGASGGVAIIWDEGAITLDDIQVCNHFIQATFHITGTNVHGHLTNVYFP